MRNNRKRAATKESPPQNKQQENSGGGGENVDGLERGRRADGGFGANCEGQKSQQKCWGQMGEEEGGEGHMEEKIENNGRGDGIVGPQLVVVAPFSLSWRVEWSGTFPVGKISAENVAKRLDSLIGPSVNGQQKRRLAGTNSILAISPNGVIATAVDNPKTIFLSHPIRKVCCVVGRVETRQLAYITREQPSHSGHHIPYRKQCHVFRTETAFEVEEIESVLSSAFQQALSKDSLPLQMMNSPSPKLRLASASVRDVATSPLHLDLNPSPLKTPKKEKGGGFLERSRSQMRISSSSLIQKIFGTPKKQQKSPEFKKPPLPSQPNQNGVRFRKPRWPLTPLRSCTSSTACSTPKRPIPSNNDGFLQPPFPAPPPFQSSTMIDAKRNSAASNNSKFATQQRFSSNSSNHSPPNKQNCIKNDGFLVPSGPGEEATNLRGATNCAQIELVYDERLKEWIYPMDVCMGEELERLAYFCGPNEKDYVMDQLRRMPIGHFMLRLSGSRRKCLALSVRVEENEANRKGIAHYLVIRNEQGYRIRGSKRYFQSLPMLVTHHSVLAEQLPCRLKLSDWRWIQEPQMMRRRQSSGGSTLAALRGREEAADPTTMIRWRKPPMGGFGVQNCRQIEPRARMTSSTLFSSKSSTILSA